MLRVDVGGTFTDFVDYDTETREVDVWKSFSVSGDPVAGILRGLESFAGRGRIESIRLGTTMATNALLERTVAPVAYVTTRGFRDVPFIPLTPDSGGAGRHRGGLGFSRTLLATGGEITVSQCTDHHEVPPWGLLGGQPGGLGSTEILPAGTDEWCTVKDAFDKASSSKFARITVRAGDRVRIHVPGGGGFGDPADRDRNLVAEDLREGYISRESAIENYKLRPA